MDTRIVLGKIVTLIYRTRLIGNLENDDLIRTVLGTVKTDSMEHSFGATNIPKALKSYCMELLDEKEAIVKDIILSSLTIMLEKDAKLFSSVSDSINADYDESTNKRTVTSLVKTLYNHYRECEAIDIINKISYEVKFNRSKITNFNDFIRDTVGKLEPFTQSYTTLKDPAVVNEVDFDVKDSVDALFEEVKSLNDNTSVYRFGWQASNRMMQGGLRRGEFMAVAALEHRYKSNYTNSLMASIATENKPIMTKKEIEEGKIPLILRISFEDSLPNTLQFIFQYLKSTDGEPVDPKEFSKLDTKETATYVHEKLTATGFRVKMRRVDPSQWTFMSLFNYIIELEAQGYSIHLLVLDYVTQIPTTGCVQGAMGADKRDLVRRVRNFCSGRNIACISPLQLGPEVRQMLRNGTPDHQIVKECLGKSPLDSSKSINQELDILLYVHTFTHKKKKFISVAIDRHRLPTTAEEADRFYMMKFVNVNTPLRGDLHIEDTSFKVLPKDYESSGGDGLLNEVLG